MGLTDIRALPDGDKHRYIDILEKSKVQNGFLRERDASEGYVCSVKRLVSMWRGVTQLYRVPEFSKSLCTKGS